jgi:AhpC/TSA family
LRQRRHGLKIPRAWLTLLDLNAIQKRDEMNSQPRRNPPCGTENVDEARCGATTFAAAVILLCVLCGCGRDSSTSKSEGTSPPNTITLRDLNGTSVAPLSPTNGALTVFLFLSPDCPISNRYAPEIARLHEKFSQRQVKFWIVYAGTDATPKEIAAHLREFRLPCGALFDPEFRLAKAARVRITPEAAVFTPLHGLVYHGRIDDQFADFGVKRPAPTRRDLEETLEAVLAGKPAPASSTPAIGCRISGLD